MAIEKLSEFAKDGQKNTDDLNLTDGFPVSKKPARQWFNWLFNTLTSKVNEIIDADFIPKADIVNNLTTDDAKKPVSAKQAKNLQDNKLDKTANAVSATKLKNARKINTIDFDGMQDINIEAPLRFAGHITTLEQLNAAVVDGKYIVSELDIAGIYSYGFLVVLRSGGICHQVYYPHLGSPLNNATMAMRQTWSMNGDIASWSEWRVVGTRDDSKLPLAGGTLTGDLMVNGTSNFKSINATGGITIDIPELVLRHNPSGRYLYINNGDWGVYSAQGNIPLPVGSGGTGNGNGRAPSADRLATPRNIFGQTFDGSGDVGGTVTASTGLVQTDSFHYIDMGRNGLDRMSFYNYGATFNFIDSQNGNVVARITQNGIDCNAASATDCSRSVIAGNGLSGGGALTSSRTVTLGTPTKITSSSTNSVTTTSHTHEIDNASTSVAGVVQLNNTLTSTSSTQALTAAQGKALLDMFATLQGTNMGYFKIPNANNPSRPTIVQYAEIYISANYTEYTFPIAFPNACSGIINGAGWQADQNLEVMNIVGTSKSKTGFTALATSTSTYTYIAIGY